MTIVSMKHARECLISCYQHNQPAMVTGKPGMGKTATFESICRELGIGFIDFRLPLKDPVDVGGMRVPDPIAGRRVRATGPSEDQPKGQQQADRGSRMGHGTDPDMSWPARRVATTTGHQGEQPR